MSDAIKPTVCVTCRGSEPSRACDACLGFGWHWSDGVPPTACPGPTTKAPGLPCGRSKGLCPGCGRAPEEIGGADDVAHDRTFHRDAWSPRDA